jgi:hypothetical protein
VTLRVPLVLTLVALLLSNACDGSSADRDVLAYARAVKPLAKEGGRIVQTGMKPGKAELERGEITPEVFRERAATWRRQMLSVRDQFAAVPAPDRLDPVRKLFDDSLKAYVEAIDAFVVASTRPKAQINDALAAAVPIAQKADSTYDQAVALLKKELRKLGLDESEAP